MTTTRGSRRRKLLPASPGPARTTRKRAPELESGDPVPIASWADHTITAQLADPFQSEGRLPSMEVGDVHELSPVLWMSCYSPASTDGATWWCGPLGTVAARGSLIPPDLRSRLQVFLLDVAGRFFPLNWTNPEPFLAETIEVDGGLYLDPKLDEGGLLGPSGDWCRRLYRVTGLRRYRRIGGVPREPVALERTPRPGDLRPGESLVVDLVDPS
jgi:hypothetical protein